MLRKTESDRESPWFIGLEVKCAECEYTGIWLVDPKMQRPVRRNWIRSASPCHECGSKLSKEVMLLRFDLRIPARDAINTLRNSTKLKSDPAQVHCQIAAIYADTFHMEEAVQEYTLALEADHRCYEAIYSLAMLQILGDRNVDEVPRPELKVPLRSSIEVAKIFLLSRFDDSTVWNQSFIRSLDIQIDVPPEHAKLYHLIEEDVRGVLGELQSHRESIKELVEKARRLLINGSLKEAMATAKRAVALSSKDSSPHYLLAECYRRQSDKKNWLHHLRLAAQYDWTDFKAHLTIGQYLMSKNMFEKAIPYFEVVMERNPAVPEAYLGIVECLIKVRSFREASVHATRLASFKELSREKKTALASLMLEIAGGTSSEPESARKTLSIALNLDPTLGFAYTLLGSIEYDLGHPELAIANFQKAEYLKALTPTSLYAYARCSFELKDYEKACKLLISVVKRIEEGREVVELGLHSRHLLILCYLELQKDHEAFEVSKQLTRCYPKNLSAWTARAWAAQLSGNWKEASKAYTIGSALLGSESNASLVELFKRGKNILRQLKRVRQPLTDAQMERFHGFALQQMKDSVPTSGGTPETDIRHTLQGTDGDAEISSGIQEMKGKSTIPKSGVESSERDLPDSQPDLQLSSVVSLLEQARGFQEQQMHTEAAEVFQSAANSAESLDAKYLLANALYGLAYARFQICDYARAIIDCQEARRIFDSLGAELESAGAALVIGSIRTRFGQYSSAASEFGWARYVYEKRKCERELAYLRVNEAALYRQTKQLDKAHDMCKFAIQHFAKKGLAVPLAHAYQNMGNICVEQGKLEEALTFYKSSKATFERAGLECQTVGLDLAASGIALRKGDAKRANDLLAKAEAISLKYDMKWPLAHCKLQRAHVAHSVRNLDVCRHLCKEALDLVGNMPTSEITTKASILLAGLEWGRGSLDGALQILLNAVRKIDESRLKLPGKWNRSRFSIGHQELYETTLRAAVELASEELVFEIVERMRLGILRDLHMPEDADRQSSPYAREAGLNGPLWERSVEDHLIRTGNGASVSEHFCALARIEDVDRRLYDAIERGTSSTDDSLLSSSIEVLTSAIGKIPNSLAPNEALLEFHVNDDLCLAIIVYHDSKKVIRLDVNEKWLEEQVGEHRLQMETGQSVATCRKLFASIVAPLEDYLDAANRLFLVVDGPLRDVSFGALGEVTGQMLRRFEISLLPSGSILLAAGGVRREPPNRPAFIGDPEGDLAGANLEAVLLSGLFANGELILKQEATRQRVLSALKNSDHVHFAGHVEFNSRYPELSMIRCSDGFLCLYELDHVKVKAQTVILTGCAAGKEMGTGPWESTGFGSVLLSQGVSAVIAPTWHVDDSNALEFMLQLYQRWGKGYGQLSKALRSTQIAYLDDPKTRHPYHWAAFQLFGTD